MGKSNNEMLGYHWVSLISLPQNFYLFFIVQMSANLFDKCFVSKRSNIRVKNLQKYASKCDNITYWIDELKLISPWDLLKTCPCFQIWNDTNSKEKSLDCSKFLDCVFDSVVVSLDCFDNFNLYKVIGVYEWKAYNLIDFKFYYLDSQISKQNHYLSDFLIHWKAWRLQVVSWWKFNIKQFLIDLLTYDVKHSERFLKALNEYYITREDYRIDFFHNNEIKHLNYEDVFLSDSRKNVDNLVIDRKSKKIYTGWTAWNRKDKYVYTRLYQKQVEALDKWHGELYMDYLEYEWKVWRLEFEFGSKFTTARKKVSFFGEFDNHELSHQIFEYLGLSPKNWYFSKPKNKLEIPLSKLDPYRQKRIITQTMNNIVKLHKANINPYLIVNQAIMDSDPFYTDKQVLDSYFEIALYDFNWFENLVKHIEELKITTKDYYDKIYKAQLWVDI